VAGKEADFAVTAKAVDAPGAVTIDEIAKTMGLESLAKLREALRGAHRAATRERRPARRSSARCSSARRRHKFEPPPTLVEDAIQQRSGPRSKRPQAADRSFADEGTTEAKGPARGIAASPNAGAAGPRACRNRRQKQYQGL